MFASKRTVLALRQRHGDPDRAATAAGDAAARVLLDARRVAEVSKLPELGHALFIISFSLLAIAATFFSVATSVRRFCSLGE